jgi:hypothetical protein
VARTRVPLISLVGSDQSSDLASRARPLIERVPSLVSLASTPDSFVLGFARTRLVSPIGAFRSRARLPKERSLFAPDSFTPLARGSFPKDPAPSYPSREPPEGPIARITVRPRLTLTRPKEWAACARTRLVRRSGRLVARSDPARPGLGPEHARRVPSLARSSARTNRASPLASRVPSNLTSHARRVTPDESPPRSLCSLASKGPGSFVPLARATRRTDRLAL